MMRTSVPDRPRHGLAAARRLLYASAATPAMEGRLDSTDRPDLVPPPPGGPVTRFAPEMVAQSPSANGLSIDGWRFVLLAEISNFSQLRRLLGVARADRLVLDVADQIAARLSFLRLSSVGRAMLEFRFDGGEHGEIDTVIEALGALFENAVEIDGEPHRIDMLFAAVAAPIAHADDIRMAEEVEEASALARQEQRSIVRDLSTGTPAFDRLSLIRDLSGALANGEMFVQYQPKVHLRNQKISSGEALIRWQHPTRGLILPGDFIPAAEESREIGALTLWILDQVIADQQMLKASGHDLTLSINIAGQLLGDAQFVEQACKMVRDCDAKIGFEITETSVIRDPETAISHLQIFADIGIPIAIDDYGAGLSSLAYLKQLPASELKIDKMFVLQLTSSNRDPLIVRSTIDLAHALDMEVTAEGVETQAALALLSVMGCDIAQGFLISRPLSIDAFRAFLDSDQALAATTPSLPSFDRPASFWKSA